MKEYNIQYNSSIVNWDEGLPLGNGKIGCLIYGNGPLKFSLDRVDLWDERPHPYTLEKGFCYSNLVNLSKSKSEDDWKERERLFESVYTEKPYPSKITAGRLELDFGIKSDRIYSEVDISSAVANLHIPDNNIKVEAFLSAEKYIGVAKIYGHYNLSFHIPAYISAKESNVSYGYPNAETKTEDGFLYYIQKTHTDFEYGIFVLKKQFRTYSELYFTIATNKDCENYIETAKKTLLQYSKIEYNELKSEHVNWWKKYWEKSSISIPDKLLEQAYYRSYYLFASCSRQGFYPMPLQGVWTADNDCLPPWKGDYHHDTNTQLSYQSYLKANRLDEGRVFVDYLWDRREQFKKVAKDFYGVNGLLIPGVSTISGNPMGGWSQYSLSPTMSIWIAQSFDEYYLYTGDEEFLKERAYPFFKQLGQAIYELFEERDGKLYLPLSTSPEIFDNTRQAYLKPNSNFDLALLKYLYQTLRLYSKILCKDASQYEFVLAKLDDFALSKNGGLALDSEKELEESHRHFSHLMSLYPLHLINYDTEAHKRIYEESLAQIEKYGSGMWVGFSFAMCAQIYAMAENGNATYEKLYQFCKGFVAENGFHLNGDFKKYGYSAFHYRPFTLESLFGFCDALQEMFLQDHQGYVQLFPAIPDEWKNKRVSFKNFRSRGGLLISATYEKGDVTEFVLTSNRLMEVKIKCKDYARYMIVQKGEERQICSNENGYIKIYLKEETIKCVISHL